MLFCIKDCREITCTISFKVWPVIREYPVMMCLNLVNRCFI